MPASNSAVLCRWDRTVNHNYGIGNLGRFAVTGHKAKPLEKLRTSCHERKKIFACLIIVKTIRKTCMNSAIWGPPKNQ